MSFYNLIHGQNPAADWLLGLLDLTREDVGRCRDAWVTKKGEIAVYTRNGGGNREHWRDEEEAGESCSCPGCIITYRLPNHSLYLRDEDDDLDRTYATVYFRCPEEAKALIEGMKEDRNPDEEWLKKLEALKQGMRRDVVEAMRPLFEKVREIVAEGEKK